jgi:predicted phosphodiesterase
MNIFKLLLLSSFYTLVVSATVYEDAENGTTDNWRVSDNRPKGAVISNLYDNQKKSNVIVFSGEGRSNAYFIGGTNNSKGWRNSEEKRLKWYMNFSEKFKISVYTNTTKGKRVFYYSYRDSSRGLYKNKYIRIGLGKESRNGKWVKVERNIEEDLKKYEADNRLLTINGFKVQGSGRIDEIALVGSKPPQSEDGNVEITRGPYLQQGSSNGVIVRWRTDKATDSKVTFGTDASSLTSVASNEEVTTEHELFLTKLNAESRYYYRVGNSSKMFKIEGELSFMTAPKEGSSSPVRVWVLGDSGAVSEASKDVYRAYLDFTGKRNTDLILMLGDNAFKRGTDREYQAAVFDKYSKLLAQTSLWSVYGNHDAMTPESYFNNFTFPQNAELGGVPSYTENYYSYNYGNIHFVVLDSSKSSLSKSGKMMKWLKKDLKNNHSKWLIAAWHHAPYTKGSYDSDKRSRMIRMRKNFLPTLEKYGVDLVLAGHSHVYERSMFIHGHYGKSSTFSSTDIVQDGDGRVDGDGAYQKGSKEGTVYVVLGSSGKPKEDVALNHPIMVTESKRTLGSVVIDTKENQMDVKYLTNKGIILDSFRIEK